MEEFEIKQQPMICGSYEAEIRKYKKIEGQRYIWYISNELNNADNIYLAYKTDEQREKSAGFGGSIINFTLEDETIDSVKGPWHSNSDSFFNDTGIDILNNHLTFGVISKSKKYTKYPYFKTILEDVIYKDKDWTIGKFSRIEELAQKYANDLNQIIYYYSQSLGGSTISCKKPEIKN